jgi:Leucine-rich repeat (LRR) protein
MYFVICLLIAHFSIHVKTTSLNFSFNGNHTIRKDLFKDAPIIIEGLDLAMNNIQDIEIDSFIDLPSFFYIDLIGNNLKLIKKGMFHGLSDLRELYLEENLISSIEKHGFEGLIGLKTLGLADNKLNVIESDTFNYLTTLEALWFDRNMIYSIEWNSFVGLANLNWLTLNNNRIKSIANGTFDSLVNLSELWLFLNEFVEIDSLLLKKLSNLKELYFNMNQIKRIDKGSLEYLAGLTLLSVSRNEIFVIEVDAFSHSPLANTLIDLVMYRNKIEQIQNETFSNLVNLKRLRLDQNKINSIDDHSFASLNKLLSLNLSFNSIETISNATFLGLYSLTDLYLNENGLISIGQNSFVDLVKLQSLNMATNQLKYIQNGLFRGLNELKYLNINDNELVSIEVYSFSPMVNLIELKLNINKLEEISVKMFENLNNLVRLEIFNNRLIEIKSNSFTSLNKLDSLRLNGNYLSGNQVSAFFGLENLKLLDLSLNQIKVIENWFFANVYALKELFLKNNRLKRIESYSMTNLSYLETLDLSENELNSLQVASFYGLGNLRYLSLSSNKFDSMESTRLGKNLKILINLEVLEMSDNFLEYTNDSDFISNSKLKQINLNRNPIKIISYSTFSSLIHLESLQLARNQLNLIDLNKFKMHENFIELDLSFEYILVLRNLTTLKNLQKIKLVNVRFVDQIDGFKSFLNPDKTTLVDFSENDLPRYDMFNNLDNLKELILRQVNLTSMSQIDFKMLKKLTKLDLSFNKLTEITFELYNVKSDYSKMLEHLDFGHNRIGFISKSVFGFREAAKSPLKYLNLESNCLILFEIFLLTNYLSLEVFKLSNNSLKDYPEFGVNNIYDLPQLDRVYLDQNNLTSIKHFSFWTQSLKLLSMDFNQVRKIEDDALLNLKELIHFSIAHNLLTSIYKNNFFYLSDLKHLNLSHNRLVYIENDSFVNLNKLLVLDLSFNLLHSLEANLFKGLVTLRDLSLFVQSNYSIRLNSKSFNFLSNLSNLYLNHSMVSEYACIFMLSLRREVIREVRGKYVYYRSINLLSKSVEKFSNENITFYLCELTFRLFQFKIHYNLKTDVENEKFYETCQFYFIQTANYYKRTYEKCYTNGLDDKEEDQQNEKNFTYSNRYLYYVMNFSLIVFFTPFGISILLDLYFQPASLS